MVNKPVKEFVKKEWKTFAQMANEINEKKEEQKIVDTGQIAADKGKKEQEAGEDTRDKKKKAMTGEIATSPEMNPKVDYKY
jgi:hypothetical protein